MISSSAGRISSGAAVLLTSALLLSGCAGSGDAAADTAATHTVESDFGEVTLPTDPQSALGFYTTDVDILITLGIPLADRQPIRGVDGYEAFPAFFPAEELEGIETFANFPEYNYEEVLATAPDLILNGLGYDDDAVTRLADIAPTYSIDAFDGSDWRDKFKQVAEALDRVDEYQAWMDRYQAKVDEVKAALTAAGIDPVVGPVSYSDGTVNVSCYGVPCLVFADLGLRTSPLAEGSAGTDLSLEQLEQLNGIDVVFTSSTPESVAAGLDPFEELAGNTIWQQLPFAAADAVHTFDLEMIYGSPSGQYAFLEVVEKALLG